MVQSSVFLKEPGSAPAYSGVEISTADAAARRARRSATAGGSGSWSSSGLKCGSSPTPSNITAVTPWVVSAAAVRSTAWLLEPLRRLPQSSSSE
jgi:hypothetical protein